MLHKSVGPLQNRERCMLSDRPSLKLPVPHLGQGDIFERCGSNQMVYEESDILYKFFVRNIVATIFVYFNRFNEVVTKTETCFLLFNCKQETKKDSICR